MLPSLMKTLCTHFLITVSCIVVFLSGHYFSYLILLPNRTSSTDGQIDYLTTLERDLDKLSSWLPRALSQVVQGYFQHDTHIRRAALTVVRRALSLAQTCVFNRATVLLLSWATKLSISCGYIFISGVILFIAGPFLVKVCIWMAVGINVVVHLCGDVGVSLTQCLLRGAEGLRVVEDSVTTPNPEGQDASSSQGDIDNEEQGRQRRSTRVTDDDNTVDCTETEQLAHGQLDPDASQHDHGSHESQEDDILVGNVVSTEDYLSKWVHQADHTSKSPRSSNSFVPELSASPRTLLPPRSRVSPGEADVSERKRSLRKYSLEDDAPVPPSHTQM